jgi:hypothetical protein
MWSKRARERLAGLRVEYGWLSNEAGTDLVRTGDETTW